MTRWFNYGAKLGVFYRDEYVATLDEAVDQAWAEGLEDDDVVILEAVPIGGLPGAREILESWRENVGVDVDGNGPDVDVDSDELDKLDAAIAAFNRQLPEWFESGARIDLTGYPWPEEE